MIFGHDITFWVAVAGATLFKLITSPTSTIRSAALTVLAAVFSAWAFTDFVIAYFDLSSDVYQIPVAALVALTGEGVMRWLTNLTPTKALQFWKELRK